MPKRGKSSSPGKFLANSKSNAQHGSVSNAQIDKAVKVQQGMSESSQKTSQAGFFIDLQEFGEKISGFGSESTEITQAISSAVEAAVKAAIPSIVAAVKDACIKAVKEEINPTLLITQYKQDELDQQLRRENIRITGFPEGEEGEDRDREGACRKRLRPRQRHGSGCVPRVYLLMPPYGEKGLWRKDAADIGEIHY